MQLDKSTLLRLYETMVTIRVFETRVKEEFAKGRIPGFVHLYAGEEAVATGIMAHLRNDDTITSTNRGHGHCIAKGCAVDGMMAEIFGKADGLCKGKGGSMHIADVSKGMLGANGIVGGGPPLACGAVSPRKCLAPVTSVPVSSAMEPLKKAPFMNPSTLLLSGNSPSFLLRRTTALPSLLLPPIIAP